jgi:hypothetical protein
MPLPREQQSNVFDADIQTDFGTFRVRATKIVYPDLYDNTITLNIGGIKDDCLTFSIPIYKKEPIKLAYAQSTSDKVQCTLDSKEIKGDSTFKMICLGFTIITEITDQRHIELDDMSHFTCDLPDGSRCEVELAPFMFAFHGKTWYESKFGAMLVNVKKRNQYIQMKCRLHDPKYKPSAYDFGGNESLKNMLNPYFEKVRSWHDFFNVVTHEFGKNKCSIVYPWLKHALQNHIFKNEFEFMGDKWILNFDGMPNITYNIIKVYSSGIILQSGGTNMPFEVIDTPFVRESSPPEFIDKIDFAFFKKKNRTRRLKIKF